MPSGDTIEDAEDVEAMVLASAGCRLPTSQPALDDYDQALVDAQLITGPSPSNAIFPEYGPLTDGHPGTPTLLYPLHQATGVPTTVTLTWDESDETDCYLIAIGTTDPPPLSSQCIQNPCCSTPSQCCTPDSEFEISGLQSGTTYYWQVVSRDSCGHFTYSAVRSFTTAP